MIAPLFFGKVVKGKLILEDRALFEMYLETLTDKEVQVSVKRKSKPRSDRQNRYYHGVVIKILADHLGYSPDEMHDALRLHFLIDRERKIPTIKSTTSLDTIGFENYMSQIRQWASEEFSLYIPEPNETDLEGD